MEEELEDWWSFSGILEVDLEYPKSLHDPHNDYPLAPETVTVNTVEKLIPNLRNKKKYVVHYENLKLYERLGLKITKIHRGINFEERAWLKEYIDLNTELRTKEKNKFEKDFFKLMNNFIMPRRLRHSFLVVGRPVFRIRPTDSVCGQIESFIKVCPQKINL